MKKTPQPPKKGRQGFASMPHAQRSAIASLGGHAVSHRPGHMRRLAKLSIVARKAALGKSAGKK